MLRSLLRFVGLFLLAAVLSSCASISIPDISPGITLPASGDGYQISTITHKEIRTPKEEWEAKLPYGIILFSDDWAKLKEALLQNCLSNECKQTVGTLDQLFISVDEALKGIPAPDGIWF
jgi:hypothetical protein